MAEFRILNDFSQHADRGTLLDAVARARGCTTDAEVAEFLAPLPLLHNPVSGLLIYPALDSFLSKILSDQSSVLIYGDYDCDGITATVIMRDLLLAGGLPSERLQCFAPDRFAHGYGLTDAGLAAASGQHGAFQTLIAVDCGSPSHAQLQRLKGAGVPTLVIDHHDLASPGAPHPATVHFNPKDFAETAPDVTRLRAMSAAGLAFLVADAFAAAHPSLATWSRDRALILGGLGTLVDVMPLTGLNRILAKHSLHLAARSDLERCVPGLWALKKVSQTGRIDEGTYGFQWGPRLNAAGRLDSASLALALLATSDTAEADALARQVADSDPDVAAKALDRKNAQRKEIQAEIHEQAREMALAQLTQPDSPKVLVLHHAGWHTGVVGIVASKIREEFNRPTILFGRTPDATGPWKGSGRSIPEYDLGAAVREAVGVGVITTGGGHGMAAGMSALDEAQIAGLRARLNAKWNLPDTVLTPTAEILGAWDARSPLEWWRILETLQPFGQGNPKPVFSLSSATVQSVKPTSSGCLVGLATESGKTLQAYSSETAWTPGSTCERLLLDLSRSVKADGTIYLNWSIAGCYASRATTPATKR